MHKTLVIAFCLIVMSCKSTQVDEVLYQANQVDSAPKRVIRVTPAYPQNAWKEKTEGWVKILAVVDKSGKVSNMQIIESQPKGVFEYEAKRAFGKWAFIPAVLNRKAVSVYLEETFKFKI
jgi:protein TonB